MKRALITGLTGQDGSFLAEYLLERGYEVFGLVHDTPQTEPTPFHPPLPMRWPSSTPTDHRERP